MVFDELVNILKSIVCMEKKKQEVLLHYLSSVFSTFSPGDMRLNGICRRDAHYCYLCETLRCPSQGSTSTTFITTCTGAAEGGNAVDAAITVSLVLGVTEPAGSGIGGQGMMIIQKPNHVPFAVNGSSLAPQKLPDDLKMTGLRGRRASTVPSLLRLLDFVHSNYGSGKVPWQRLLEPAAHYAEKGYALGEFRRKSLLRYRKSLLKNEITRELLFTADGAVPELGSCMKNQRLADCLRRIGTKGADEFYCGIMAREIADDMAEHSGWASPP